MFICMKFLACLHNCAFKIHDAFSKHLIAELVPLSVIQLIRLSLPSLAAK